MSDRGRRSADKGQKERGCRVSADVMDDLKSTDDDSHREVHELGENGRSVEGDQAKG